MGRTMEIVYNPEHLIDGADPAALASVDLAASYGAYEEAVEWAVSEAFDGATVVVRKGGVLFTQLWGDGAPDDAERDLEIVQAIANRVFERGDFWSEATPD